MNFTTRCSTADPGAGELATLRDEALRTRDAASPALKEAVQSLAETVTAMASAALADGSAPEMALARIASAGPSISSAP